MFRKISVILSLLPTILAQTKSCPACDLLLSRWDPNSKTGSCLSNPNDPVNYIINFQQCLCSPQGQSEYLECAKCNVNGDGGVPIDGLNFGPAEGFQSACSKFAADVTSVLKPSGFNAFVSVVVSSAASTPDILGQYVIADVISETVTGILSSAATSRGSLSATVFASTPTNSASAKVSASQGVTASPTTSAATKASNSGRNRVGIEGLVSILALAISGALIMGRAA